MTRKTAFGALCALSLFLSCGAADASQVFTTGYEVTGARVYPGGEEAFYFPYEAGVISITVLDEDDPTALFPFTGVGEEILTPLFDGMAVSFSLFGQQFTEASSSIGGFDPQARFMDGQLTHFSMAVSESAIDPALSAQINHPEVLSFVISGGEYAEDGLTPLDTPLTMASLRLIVSHVPAPAALPMMVMAIMGFGICALTGKRGRRNNQPA